MTLETLMTLALLQELLMALRANDTDGLAVGCESVVRLGNYGSVLPTTGEDLGKLNDDIHSTKLPAKRKRGTVAEALATTV